MEGGEAVAFKFISCRVRLDGGGDDGGMGWDTDDGDMLWVVARVFLKPAYRE